MRLVLRLSADLVLISPPARDRGTLFSLFAERFQAAGVVRDAAAVVEGLLERERIMSTAIGGGVAIPHAQIGSLERLAMAASVHPEGIDFPSLDGRPVRLVFCLIGGATSTADHLAGLARLARLARKGEVLEELISASSGAEFIEILGRLEGE